MGQSSFYFSFIPIMSDRISFFNGDDNTKEVNIPNGFTQISGDAFTKCSLTNVTIPNTVTKIGEGAFFRCLLLVNITIPNSVVEI